MKTHDELIKDFLDQGGTIEVLPAVEVNTKEVVGNLTKKQANLISLADAELFYGEKNDKKAKPKKTNIENINFDLIPEHIKNLILSKREVSVETKEDI
jgi:hypothetical protein